MDVHDPPVAGPTRITVFGATAPHKGHIHHALPTTFKMFTFLAALQITVESTMMVVQMDYRLVVFSIFRFRHQNEPNFACMH